MCHWNQPSGWNERSQSSYLLFHVCFLSHYSQVRERLGNVYVKKNPHSEKNRHLKGKNPFISHIVSFNSTLNLFLCCLRSILTKLPVHILIVVVVNMDIPPTFDLVFCHEPAKFLLAYPYFQDQGLSLITDSHTWGRNENSLRNPFPDFNLSLLWTWRWPDTLFGLHLL